MTSICITKVKHDRNPLGNFTFSLTFLPRPKMKQKLNLKSHFRSQSILRLTNFAECKLILKIVIPGCCQRYSRLLIIKSVVVAVNKFKDQICGGSLTIHQLPTGAANNVIIAYFWISKTVKPFSLSNI